MAKYPAAQMNWLIDESMEDRKWPCFEGFEGQMVRQKVLSSFQIAVGKHVQKKKWEEIADPQEYSLY
jgi:hypothetical protein